MSFACWARARSSRRFCSSMVYSSGRSAEERLRLVALVVEGERIELAIGVRVRVLVHELQRVHFVARLLARGLGVHLQGAEFELLHAVLVVGLELPLLQRQLCLGALALQRVLLLELAGLLL